MPASIVHKVYTCVTRVRDGETDVLVFAHRGIPSAGLQLPGGSLEPGEEPIVGAMRELEEESGLKLAVEGPIEVYDWVNPEGGRTHRRHIFRAASPTELPDAWSISPRGENEEAKGFIFDFFWLSLAQAARDLTADQGRSTRLL